MNFRLTPVTRKAIYMVAALVVSGAAAIGFIDANTASHFLEGFAPILEGSAGLLSIFSLILAFAKTHVDSDVSRFDVENEVAARMDDYARNLNDQVQAAANQAAETALRNIDLNPVTGYTPKHELSVNNMLEYYKHQ